MMLDFAGIKSDVSSRIFADDLDALASALAALGFTPPPRYGTSRNVVCGSALQVSVRDIISDGEEREKFTRRLCGFVNNGIPVSLSPLEFCCEGSRIDSWQRFCEVIRHALAVHKLSGRHVGLCVHAYQMPLEAYRLIADAVLGRGQRYVFLDSLQMSAHGNPDIQDRADANWSFLWRQRNTERPVMPVYGGIVRSACPLLADEVAATVLPGSGLHSPVNAAWLPITLPLTRFATSDGQIEWPLLQAGIRQAVMLGEQMLDQVYWPDPGQRADARLNRRLAVEICAIGDLVVRQGEDPTRLECLNWLVEAIGRIRGQLHEESQRIAAEHGAIPALQEADHVSQWSAGPHRESWHQRWEDALRRSAVRHRNLLVMSPYSLIPTGASSAPAFSDLLPAIGLADAWSFAAPADFHGWNAAEYRYFHRRARATIQGSHSASFVAAGV